MHWRKTFRDFAESVLGAFFRLDFFLRIFFVAPFSAKFSLAVIVFVLRKIIETRLAFGRNLIDIELGI